MRKLRLLRILGLVVAVTLNVLLLPVRNNDDDDGASWEYSDADSSTEDNDGNARAVAAKAAAASSPDPGTSTSATPKDGDLFAPGTLSLSRLQAYNRCYANPAQYANHTLPGVRCSISKKHNLTYFMVAKSGSSTSRVVMKETFDGEEKRLCRDELDGRGRFHFTVFRDPTSRFYSSYGEMFVRWFKNRKRDDRRAVPERYERFLAPFQNLNRPEYKKLFLTEGGMAVLTGALEQFVRDYDAADPFDGHLGLQVPRLVNIDTGRTYQLDAALDTHDMERQFKRLADAVGAPTPNVIHAMDRGKGRRINETGLTSETRRKMCQLSAIDYCCLNYPLPVECAAGGAGLASDDQEVKGDGQAAVQCRWVSKPTISDELLIEAVSPFPP